MPTKNYIHRIFKTIIFSGKIFFVKKYTYRASALAFTTLFAIVPYAIVLIYLAAWFPSFNDMLTLSKDYILSHFVPGASNTIEHYFQIFIQQANRLPTLNLLFLIISAIIMIDTIEETLNEIWKVTKRKKIYLTTILYFIIILFIPIVIALSATLSAYAITIPSFVFHTLTFKLGHLILLFLPVVTNTFIFTLIYILVPNVSVKLWHGLLGGLLASILLEFARLGFGLYIKFFPTYAVIYGAFAVIPIFLIWLYIFWLIFIFCALVTATYAKRFAKVANLN